MRLAAPDRRKKLQTAALELFSRKGYQGTTTREIARSAGVSEALLFRHFATKEDLYWSVLDEQCAVRGGRARLESILRSEGDDDAVFAAIAEDILIRNFSDSRLYRLLLFSALENHQLSERFFRTHISQHYEAIAAYIRDRIRLGRFRDLDAFLAARLFIGMTLHYFLVEELFAGSRERDANIKQVSRLVAQIWLSGMTKESVRKVVTNTAHPGPQPPSKSLSLDIPKKAELLTR